MKFKAPFYGKKAGDIYPTRFQIGEECPPELEAAARSLDVLAVPAEDEPPPPDAPKPVESPSKRRKRG